MLEYTGLCQKMLACLFECQLLAEMPNHILHPIILTVGWIAQGSRFLESDGLLGAAFFVPCQGIAGERSR